MENSVTVQIHTDLYRRALPFVDEAISAYSGGGELTDRELDTMVNHVVTRGNFRGQPVRGLSGRGFDDLVRGLLLSRIIFGNCGRGGCGDYYYNYYPYYYPYYSFGRSFGGHRHGRGRRR